MPCFDTEVIGRWTAGASEESRERFDLLAKVETLQVRLAWFEAALCLLAGDRDNFNTVTGEFTPEEWEESGIDPNDLERWYTEHSVADQRRRALEKLTPAERELLGL